MRVDGHRFVKANVVEIVLAVVGGVGPVHNLHGQPALALARVLLPLTRTLPGQIKLDRCFI